MNIHRHFWPTAATIARCYPAPVLALLPAPVPLFGTYAYAAGQYHYDVSKANVIITCRKRRKVVA